MTAEDEQTLDDDTDALSDDEDEVQIYDTVGPSLTRRDILRGTAAAAGAAATGGAATQFGGGASPVGEADAIAASSVVIGAACAIVIYESSKQLVNENQPDPNEVDEAVAEQAHIDHYERVEGARESVKTFHRAVEELIKAPEESGFAAVGWSEIRKSVFNDLVNEESQATANSNARDTARQLVSEKITKWIEEWNRIVRQTEFERYVLWRKAVADDSFSESDALITKGYSGANSGYGSGRTQEMFPSPGNFSSTDEIPDYEQTRTQYPVTLPDGTNVEIEVAYTGVRRGSGDHNSYEYISWPGAGSVDEYTPATEDTDGDSISDGIQDHNMFVDGRYAPADLNPDWGPYKLQPGMPSSEGAGVTDPYADTSSEAQPIHYYEMEPWHTLIKTAYDWLNNALSEIDTYVEGIYNAYEAGEINKSDILSAQDIVSEYGSETLSRAVAELIHAGYAVDSQQVDAKTTISGGGLSEQKRGLLLLDTQLERLRDWEFGVLNRSYDSNNDETTLTVQIDDPSIDTNDTEDSDDGETLEWVISVAPDGSNTANATVTLPDLNDERKADVTVPGDRTGDVGVEALRNFSAMNMVTRVSADTTINEYEAAALLEPTEDGVNWHYLDGSFTVEEIHIDGRDYLEYTQYAYRDAVPTESYGRMQKEAEVREEVHVTIDNAGGGGGGGGVNLGDGDALTWVLAGLGGLTGLGILAQLLSDDEKR